MRLLRSLSYRVEAFSSAADFLASSSLDRTACLITDVDMPAMTGHQLHARLVELGNNIPTIFVTAHTDDVVRSQSPNGGIVCCLRKPFNDNELADCVQRALEGSKLAGRS